MILELGQRVIAKANTAICSIGERGVVYELYHIKNCAGVSVIFERGGYDGFSCEEQESMLTPLDESDVPYWFENVIKMRRDWEAGRFTFVDEPEVVPIEALNAENDV